MTNADTSRTKLLFVLSNDFGELLNSMYFVRGRPFATTVMMPKRLFAQNGDISQVSACTYESPADVVHYVRQGAPDIVFLFSGYLYGVNKIFDVARLAELVRELRENGCKLVTSDPFLGLMAKLNETTFSDRHPAKAWLTEHFSQVFEVLRNVIHLYVINPDSFASSPSVSFFNERIIVDETDLAKAREDLVAEDGIDTSRRRWLFVLSLEDYGAQVNRLGQSTFDEILVQKLRETAELGRQPILIAPQTCVNSVNARSKEIESLMSVPFCPYDLFMNLLIDAEYVFYWNLFSSSIPIRLLNGMPFFLFDAGHMARAIPPMFELGMQEYYRDSPLVYLDHQRCLTCEDLASRATADEEQGMAESREYFRRSPNPEETVRSILGGEV